MPTKLGVFNDALRILGQPLLSTPDQQNEDGRQLRDAWEPVVNSCYEMGDWKSSTKRSALARSDTVPEWGWQYYYPLPNDYMRTVRISNTGQWDDDFTDYEFEQGKIATNAANIYLRYVSRDLITLAPGSWTQAFADYVSASLAFRVAPKLNSSALQAASQVMEDKHNIALSIDAIKDAPTRRKEGSFVRAVRGYGNDCDGGRR